MALLKVNNVRITGISAGVPKNIVKNIGDEIESKEYDASDFVETTGVAERRVTNELTTSDLCYGAAEKLIADLGWDKSEIQALFFITQFPDYIIPATSCILQNKLGLSKDCYAMDISLGCSGWVYGLCSLASLMQTGNIKKALLLAGDGKRTTEHFSLHETLFGHAGTVTALEYEENAKPMYFDVGTDGSGAGSIIIPDGAARNQFCEDSLKIENVDGQYVSRLETRMKGMDVFSFGITTAPKSIKKLLKFMGGTDISEFDYYLFHQANLKMNKFIAKKLKLPENKVPYSMTRYGNTSSASIPLTVVTEIRNEVNASSKKLLCCGFGVGLSWGTVALEINNILISDLIEI